MYSLVSSSSNRATPPATLAAAKEVPVADPSLYESLFASVVEVIVSPLATKSGFMRKSSVGPLPLQSSIISGLSFTAPMVSTFFATAMSLMQSLLLLFPSLPGKDKGHPLQGCHPPFPLFNVSSQYW